MGELEKVEASSLLQRTRGLAVLEGVLRKRAELTDAIVGALYERGLDLETALLTAGTGMLVEQTAVQGWTQPAESRPLRDFLSDALRSPRMIAARTTDRGVVPSET